METSAYRLAPGQFQVGGMFGGNVFQGTYQPNPSLGAQFLVGLPHGFAAYGEGSWNRIFGLEVWDVDVASSLYELGGGLQWNFLHLGRFSPYIRGGAGWVHAGVGGRFGSNQFSVATDRLGGNVGGGARIYLAKGYGLLVDLRAVQCSSTTWLGRFSTGLFFQFK